MDSAGSRRVSAEDGVVIMVVVAIASLMLGVMIGIMVGATAVIGKDKDIPE